jgi:hypothetical protein
LDLDSRLVDGEGDVEVPYAEWELIRSAAITEQANALNAIVPESSAVELLKQSTVDEIDSLRAFRTRMSEALSMKGCPLHDDELIAKAEALRDFNDAAFDAFEKYDVAKGLGFGSAATMETVVRILAENWRALVSRNVDGAYTFSKIPPEVMAWLSGDALCVRLLLDGGAGCIITPAEAREVSRQIAEKLQAVEATIPAPKPKKKRAAKKEPEAEESEEEAEEPIQADLADAIAAKSKGRKMLITDVEAQS